MRDLGSDVHSITVLRDVIASGLIAGPLIVAAGSGSSGTGGHADSSNNTKRDIAGGLGQQMFDDEMKAIVDTAHLFGRKVEAHARGADGIMAALRAGVDSIEHGTYTDANTNAEFRRLNAWLVPTMVAPHAAQAQARAGARSRATLAKAEETVAVHNENIARAIKDGVRIAVGTDSGVSDHGPLEDVAVLEHIRFVMGQGIVHALDGARQPFPPRQFSIGSGHVATERR